jgi:RNA polymerase-associated protein LEO1
VSIGGEQYQLISKSFAPPKDGPYHEMVDAHYYAAAAHLHANLLVVVGHVTEQYTVKPPKGVKDDAVIRLSESLAAAARGSHGDGDMIIRTTQDPELQKKQAEQAEKERLKAQRRRETAAARIDGVGRYRSGGLSIGDLEGGRRAPGASRKRGAQGAARAKRRRPEYDSDDDLPPSARRQDDYDLEDDFIAASDEEELESGEGDDDDEDLLDDDEDEAPRSKRQKTADAEEADADADAEADLDDDVPGPAAEPGRGRRRNVIEDDDE